MPNQVNKKYNSMQKTILRNAEIKNRATNVHVFTEQQLERAYQQQQLEQTQKEDKENNAELLNQPDNPLHYPRAHSSAKAAADIQEVEKTLHALKIQDVNELSPATRAVIAPKITRKLNFAPNQIVYKNLISLNVNDSILLPQTKPNLRKKYERTETNRLPVPDLADFLEPLPPLHIPCPQINCQLEFIAPNYDSFDAYTNYYGC